MKSLGAAIVMVLLVIGIVDVVHAESDAERVAAASARAWLGLIDDGRYSQSWKDASTYFRGATTENGWNASLRGVRAPLGRVLSRDLRSAKETTILPGAPDGRYVVMEFGTAFANKASAVETVTFMMDKDGQWKAAGYFIR